MKLPEIPKNWREILLDLAEKASHHLGIQEATLGNKIFNDADFFPNIRKGSGCGVDRYIRVIAWFKENLPHSVSHSVVETKVRRSTTKNLSQGKN